MECRRILTDRKIIAIFWLLLLAATGIFLYQQFELRDEQEFIERQREEGYYFPTYEERQAEHVDAYQEKIAAVAGQSDLLSSISIFGGRDSFASRNISRTKEDFAGLENISVKRGNYEAVERVIEFDAADYIIFLFGFILVWFFFEDERKGLWNIWYATPEGRKRLVGQRIGVLAVGNACFTGFCYFVLFVVSIFFYGGVGDLNNSAQSVILLGDFTLKVSVLGFLILFTLLHALLAAASSLFAWMCLMLFRNHIFGIVILILVMAVEGSLSVGVSDVSAWSVLKYENLFRLIHPGDILYSYRNYNLFGHPVNCFWALLGVLFFVAAVSAAGAALILSKRRPVASPGKAEIYLKRMFAVFKKHYHSLLSHLSVMGTELYKILIVQRGFLFVLLWLYILIVRIDVTDVQYYGTVAVLRDIYSEYSGPDDGRVREYIKEQEEIIAQVQEEYDTALVRYVNGEIGSMEFGTVSMKASSYTLLIDSIGRIKDQLAYMDRVREEQGIEPWLFWDKPYKFAWTGDGLFTGQGYGTQEVRAIINITLMVLLLSSVFSYDRASNMEKLLHSTANGRERLYHTKIRMAFLVSLSVGLISYGLELYEIQANYPFVGLAAPVQSLSFMEKFPFHISIGAFMIFVVLLRILTLLAISMLIYAITYYICGIKGTICTLAVMDVPAALQLLGLPWCRYLSVAEPLIFVRTMNECGFWHGMASVIFVWLLGTAAYWMLKRHFAEGRNHGIGN